jgi:hypothetical protein
VAIATAPDYGAAMSPLRRHLLRITLLAAAAAIFAAPAQPATHAKKHRHHRAAAAATPAPPKTAGAGTQRLGTVEGWTAYQSQDAAGKVCFLVGRPQKSEPAGAARKPPMAMVTHRPAEKIVNVVSFVAGYALKEGSDASLEIGAGKFDLFTKDDSAWARTAELDKAIVTAMARGKRAIVRGQPQRGPATTDTYSLAGFPQALALIDKACGIKR